MLTTSPARSARYISSFNVRASTRTTSPSRDICPVRGSTHQAPTRSGMAVRRSIGWSDYTSCPTFKSPQPVSDPIQDFSGGLWAPCRCVTTQESVQMIRALLLATILTATAVPLQATSYTLEPVYTQGGFRWNHLCFSIPAAQFAQGHGTVEFDAADPTRASVTVTIPLSTLYTGVPGLDEHFRSSDFFDTARFPTARFK